MTIPAIHVFPRDEFLAERFSYTPGEHVTMLAPTQWGKTTLAQQLLALVSTPKTPTIALVMKPRDKVVTRWAKDSHMKITRSWPPSPVHTMVQKPPGYILWPKHVFIAERDDVVLETQFRRALRDCYKRGDRQVFADEIMGLTQELGLAKDCRAMWTRGSAMGCGLWSASQRPSDVPLYAYSQANHLFLGNISDARDRKRFGEIGGIDPKHVEYWSANLGVFQWLYISRRGNGGKPACCIVDA